MVMRDLDRWIRLEFLGVAAQSGLARALRRPMTSRELADQLGWPDQDLAEAFLQLGVAVGELGFRHGRYRIRGRRLRAVADEASDDVAGLAEEVVVYDNAVYRRLAKHLAGAPPGGYLSGAGSAIARASRLAEGVVGPYVAAVVAELRVDSVLDVGCGTGVNLRWAATAAPGARLVGVDLDSAALATAEQAARRWGIAERCELRVAGLDALPADLRGPYDLVILAQNIYYWAPEDRTGVFRRLRDLVGTRGAALVISATPRGFPLVRHLDMMLRVTKRNWRLPTADELDIAARQAGFAQVRTESVLPLSGLVACLAGTGDPAR
jgi:SAM-dependent methyltransferase